jgi:hypothetical protein
MDSVPGGARGGQDPVGTSLADLGRFRGRLYGSLCARADALFELTDALLCWDGPVTSLVELSLAPEHRRGHGGLYDALNAGRVEPARLRAALARTPLPRTADGRLVLAVDVSSWLRVCAPTSPQLLHCHTELPGSAVSLRLPGWPYSFVAALEPERTSWTALLDAVRLGPDDDATAVTAAQLRGVIERLIAAGQWVAGDPEMLVVADAGYDVPRLAWLLADLPVILIGRLASNRVLFRPALGRRAGVGKGPPPRHGPPFALARPVTWGEPEYISRTCTDRYGRLTVRGWGRLHPRLTHRGGWLDHPGQLPIVEGTLIRLAVERLPGRPAPRPVWLWCSVPAATGAQIEAWWRAFVRRFDLEQTFRFCKQTLGWTRPRLRAPQAADRWTWLVLAAHTQLRLARPAAEDLPRPWERRARGPRQLSPARVRRGFRNLRATSLLPARAPRTPTPGPGRAPGVPNRHPAPRYHVGKTTKRARTLKARHQQTG